jgi:predicted DCC family thiol-disulfide oxidoreductase YuxK
MHDPDAVELLAPLPPSERFANWHLVLVDGTLVGRGAGGVVLLRMLRGTRGAGRLLAALPAAVVEAAYAVVARNRRLLGRLVPNGSGPRRFP